MRILYLDLDSLNPSHFGCYGYHRNTSPTIDALAAKALRCTNVYVSDAPCLPSRTALYSGRFGIQTGVVGHIGTAAQPKVEGKHRGFRDRFTEQGLVGQLQKAGLHTAMISPFGQRHSAHHFYAGFHEIHNTGENGMESAEKITPVVMRWLEQNASRDNWYLHINYWDAHTPYRVPLSYGEPFAHAPLPAWFTPELIQRHNQKTGPHSSLDITMWDDKEDPRLPRHPGKITDMTSLRRMIDGYDTGIRYIDDQVKMILKQLETAGVLEETAIIISGDHGENMGELGIYGEHGTADQATCNIPMIIKWPGAGNGLDTRLHYHLDWAPTLMDLLGRQAPAIWDGRSYAENIRTGAAAGRDELILGQCCHVCQRSVRFDRWLYIRTYHDGFHLFPEEMLFDLVADPREQNDVAARHPEVCRDALCRLTAWHDRQMAAMSPDTVDPLWTVIAEGGPAHAQHDSIYSPLTKYVQRLEETGRTEGAAALRAKYGKWIKPA